MNEARTLLQDASIASHSLFRVLVTPAGNQARPNPTSALYFLDGALSASDLTIIASQLLADPVTETFAIDAVDSDGRILETVYSNPVPSDAQNTLEVMLLPGVTDPTAEYLVRAAHALGITALRRAASGRQHILPADLDPAALEQMALDTFNPVIQRHSIHQPIAPLFVPLQGSNLTVEVVAVRDADDAGLLRVSAERRLALSLEEMVVIRSYFQQEGRDPTDAELEMLAQTWSEHCVHKTFRAKIDYMGPAHGAAPDSPAVEQTIDGLLKTYIRAATEKLAKPWVRSAFVDNAGIIAFDEEFDLAFKVETHNHPSALEPFGGANTGVGGVVRDILGVSARPIANTDILCFGMPDATDIPDGVLNPNRIAEGVIHGVEDYGNKMGIPTVNGAILYHDGYTANPLVFCGCLGLLPHNSHPTGVNAGDLIVSVGGRTGRDGLRGATFSSMEMDTTTSEIAGSSVQIGHPIHEKQVQEVVLRMRDAKFYSALTDCGAGGLSSAVGEMAAGMGATVRLETVPLKYPGLRPWEIWLSEAQERMVFAVPPDAWEQVQAICDGQDVEATVIGTFEPTGRLRLKYEDVFVGDLSIEFLHDGIPQRHLKAEWTLKPSVPVAFPEDEDLTQTLLQLLAHPDIRSKESVIRRYDHEVQGGTAVKPLVGVADHGPSDAAVIVPQDAQPRTRGVAISNGICPLYGEIDPYAMAWAAVDEAIRNLVAVGADPDQIAILDNFCWGNPNLPDRLGTLVRASQGCYDAALAYGVPFISGKDSLNNEYADSTGQRHAIPGTLLISAIGIVPDVTKTVTMDLKASSNALYLIGETGEALGGSHYALLHGAEGGTVPQPNVQSVETYRAVYQAIQAGLIQSAHDCSEGGFAVALAEMAIAARLGIDVQINDAGVPASWLYEESSGRLIIEVSPENASAFEQVLCGVPLTRIGSVTDGDVVTIQNAQGDVLLKTDVTTLENAWRGDVAAHVSPLQAESAEANSQAVKVSEEAHTRISGLRTSPPRVLIIHANGTNRDHDAALACELAGGKPEIVHVNQLLNGERNLLDYHMLVVPGGFSYGDELGAGKLWAFDLRERLGLDMRRFVDDGRPVLGICNGFQALVKTGLLPGDDFIHEGKRSVTLTFNETAHFECRWVYLQPNPNSTCLFTQNMTEPIHCPVAHGEGRLLTTDKATVNRLAAEGLIALTYMNEDGSAAAYPANPNGSLMNIAGITNRAGNVLGLMPHPEDHIFPWQHPRWRRGEGGMNGLRLFQNAIQYA